MDPLEIVGRKFGTLIVEGYAGYYDKSGKGRKRHWYRCRCGCGNEYVARRDHLLEGRIISCGRCRKIEREGDYYRYTTSSGESFLFDPIDYGLAESHYWCISHKKDRTNNSGYVVARGSDGSMLLFSRMAIQADKGVLVDHVNGNTLDNRRNNLRVVTVAENSRNTGLRTDNSTGYKGVGRILPSGKYRAYIGVNEQFISLGSYDNPEEAARAYDEAARFYFGEFACVNFPMPGEQGCYRNQKAVNSVA